MILCEESAGLQLLGDMRYCKFALQWVISLQISSKLKQWHTCSLSTWIFLYIINASPTRESCLQLLSKARADTALPPLLTKRFSDGDRASRTECKEPGSNNARGSESQKLSAKSVWVWIFFFPFTPKSSLWTHTSMIPSFPYCFHQMTLIVMMAMLCACVFWRKGQDLRHTTSIFAISDFSLQRGTM